MSRFHPLNRRAMRLLLGPLALAAASCTDEGLTTDALADVERPALDRVAQDAFPVTSVHVAWLAQPAPRTLPSGHGRFEGWEHLWYDDADDDRLDGYDTVVIDGMFDADGTLIYAHGTFTVREKLDDYEFDEFLDGSFDLNRISQGRILWEGRFALTPQRPQDSAGWQAVAMNADGMKALYFFPDPFEFPVLHSIARIVSPNGR